MNIRNNTIKQMAALLICLCLLLAVGVTAHAHEVPDLKKTGSISVAMRYGGKAVPGGTLTLYRVGAISQDGGDYSFVLTEKFKKSRLSLKNISSPSLTGRLAAYAADRGLAGTEVKLGKNGKAAIDGLKLGLYLVVQTRAAAGYQAVSPFLVSLPMNQDGTYLYDVDVAPKMGDPEKTPEIPGSPVPPKESTLPQTGQLNWPVPLLATLGLCLFLAGFALCFGKKEIPYEA